jgi:hypothetical protein
MCLLISQRRSVVAPEQFGICSNPISFDNLPRINQRRELLDIGTAIADRYKLNSENALRLVAEGERCREPARSATTKRGAGSSGFLVVETEDQRLLGSCHDDLDKLREAASDASDAAGETKSASDDLDDCRRDIQRGLDIAPIHPNLEGKPGRWWD